MAILILVLLLISIVVVFSVQNAIPVAVNFLFWKFEASLAIVIFLALLAGLLAGITIDLWLRRRSTLKRQRSAGNELPSGDQERGPDGKEK